MASRLHAVLVSIRPKQWAKNVFLFAGLVFSKHLFDAALLGRVCQGFVVFCLAASSIYVFNDIRDRESDRKNPAKRHRPLSTGDLPVPHAWFLSSLLTLVSLGWAFRLDRTFALLILGYLVINWAYSLKIKQVVILDVMFVAAGFFLRVIAGTTLAGVSPSDWLIICTITLSLFIGLSKRRNEMVLMGEEAGLQRAVLKDYSLPFLDQMISVVTACTILSYVLYTVSAETVERFGTRDLLFTVPFVLFGVFRFFYLLYQKRITENPTDLILSDFSSLLNLLLWIGTVLFILYG